MWVTNITELVVWKTAPFCNRLELATQIYITITVSCDSFPLCSCFQNRHFVFSTISSEQHIAKKTLISFITEAKFQILINKKPFSF